MKKKLPFIKKVGLFFTLLIVATIPLSIYVILTQDFDIRNIASSTTFLSNLTTDKDKPYLINRVTPEQSETIISKASFTNTSKESIIKLGYKFIIDEKYVQFDPDNSSSILKIPSKVTQEENFVTYEWENVLQKCTSYPCSSSLAPGKSINLEMALSPVTNTTNLPGDSTPIYSIFSDAVLTEDLKVSNIAELPTTGSSIFANKTLIKIANAGTNQTPVCDILEVSGPMNPSSLWKGHEINFRARGRDSDDGISSARAVITKDSTTLKSYEWTFDPLENVVIDGPSHSPAFSYTFNESGSYSIEITFTDSYGETGQKSLSVKVADSNSPPRFTTDPEPDKTASNPLDLDQSYTYSMKSKDTDDDNIDYQLISKPSWIGFKTTTSKPGILDGIFNGTPVSDEHAGTHPIVFAISDGYIGHVESQIWILRVNRSENDTPKVVIDTPSTTAFSNNQAVKIQWRSSDANGIDSYDIFYTNNPTKKSAWSTVVKDLDSSIKEYTWQTPSNISGNFYIIVEATDKSSDSLTGYGVSDIFSIGTGIIPGSEKDEFEKISDLFPQILNVTPEDAEEITDLMPIISADLKASHGATIDDSTILLKLDGENITDMAEISKGTQDKAFIVVALDNELELGVHKIELEFKDSSGQTASKIWTFTIKEPVDTTDKESPTERIVEFLGYKFILNTPTILVGIVILVIIIAALLVPWLIFFSQSKDYIAENTGFAPVSPALSSPDFPTYPSNGLSSNGPIMAGLTPGEIPTQADSGTQVNSAVQANSLGEPVFTEYSTEQPQVQQEPYSEPPPSPYSPEYNGMLQQSPRPSEAEVPTSPAQPAPAQPPGRDSMLQDDMGYQSSSYSIDEEVS